ncbi:MAG: gamma-glutamyltranspeptidase / glutathione hydrolase [Thermoanaerobaculia bacterium]|jgi:gamma-glutamyltranspeptidase/glutathione hydrolase|nr:gamma-glutamyltranspeptidase / glutathione hydrolase [Thermoanaerobaculia bacterium]
MRKILATALLFATTSAMAAIRDPVAARHGMVASTSVIASRVGVDIMKKGGNAVDAAVAVAFALAVTWPAAGNLGGGGFMLLRMADGTSEAIDYRERAPLAATRDMYLDANGNVIKGASIDGYKAVGVPGTVAGLMLVHARYGKLKWNELVEPARKLADEGFIVSSFLDDVLHQAESLKKMNPWPESRRIFLRDGRNYSMGDRFRQPELAATLARIEKNPRDFYEGVTARRIVAGMRAHGGLITMQDLREYKPAIRKPLRGTYRGHDFLVMPPPSSGSIAMIEMLHMLEHYDVGSMGWQSARYLHLLTEVMRRAFADRAEFLGDPDFNKMPVAALTSAAYADERRKTIDLEHASSSKEIRAGDPAPFEHTDTTHFSIVDKDGSMVSNTYTLNDWFGSGVTAKGTGILLNNEMDDFTSRPGVPNDYQLIQSEKNAIAPRKRPLSSMTPLIVLDHGKPWLAVGAAGGPRIISTVLQIVLSIVDFHVSLQEAVDAGRIHHQWLPDEIYWEPNGTNPDTRAILERMGHKFRAKGLEDISDANVVMIDPKTGLRYGGADARRDGVAVGY